MPSTTQREAPATFDEFQIQMKEQLLGVWLTAVDEAFVRGAIYALAVTGAVSRMTEEKDLLEFAEMIGKKVQAELHDRAINVKAPWITANAHRFSGDWLQARQRQRQVAELEGRVKNLAASLSKGKLDEKKAGSTNTTNVKKRKEDELLSEIDELSIMAKKLKETRSKSS